MTNRKAKWQNDYIKRTYDRVNLTLPKGKKEIIQSYAKMQGMSTNELINKAIDYYMNNGCRGGSGFSTTSDSDII